MIWACWTSARQSGQFKEDSIQYRDLETPADAEPWRMQSTISTERYDVSDEHPLRYLRVNTVVQQFDEFLDTYGVREGELM